jgi:hypothetical protein
MPLLQVHPRQDLALLQAEMAIVHALLDVDPALLRARASPAHDATTLETASDVIVGVGRETQFADEEIHDRLHVAATATEMRIPVVEHLCTVRSQTNAKHGKHDNAIQETLVIAVTVIEARKENLSKPMHAVPLVPEVDLETLFEDEGTQGHRLVVATVTDLAAGVQFGGLIETGALGGKGPGARLALIDTYRVAPLLVGGGVTTKMILPKIAMHHAIATGNVTGKETATETEIGSRTDVGFVTTIVEETDMFLTAATAERMTIKEAEGGREVEVASVIGTGVIGVVTEIAHVRDPLSGTGTVNVIVKGHANGHVKKRRRKRTRRSNPPPILRKLRTLLRLSRWRVFKPRTKQLCSRQL